MSHPEPWRQRGGYCEYPGITPPGNPDWWTRDTRPPVVGAGEPPAAWRQALARIEPAAAIQGPIMPTPEPVDEPAPEKPEEDRDASFVRRWLALIGRPSRR